MPFQVSYSTRHRQFKQIKLITAGDDQYHICTPTIYLEAIVEGDLLGHTVEWEQTGGTLVTLQNSNTLTPFFDAVDGVDKVFTIYLDRYTPYEQSDEVRIIKTPTSFCSMGTDPDRQWFRSGIDPDPVACDDITEFVNVTVPDPTTIHGEEPGSQTIVEVTWQHPGHQQHDPYIEQYKVVENGIVVDDIPDVPIWDAGDGTGPPTEPLFYAGTFATYRIDTYYNIAGVKYVRESCTKDYTTLPVPLVKAYNDAVDKMAFDPDKQWYNRVNYLNIVRTGESFPETAFDPDRQWYRRTNYGNIVQDQTSVTGPMAFEPDSQWINITRYDPSGIGSG